jgi:hypothetical protein
MTAILKASILLVPFVVVGLEAVPACSGPGGVGRCQDLFLRREFVLVLADSGVSDRAVLIDEEHGGATDVPGIDADAVPHAVRAHHIPAVVDQDVEGESRFLDVAAHGLAILGEDADDLNPAGCIRCDVVGKLTEPVAAVRSPGAAVKVEQQAAAREEIRQRARASLLVLDHESRRLREW